MSIVIRGPERTCPNVTLATQDTHNHVTSFASSIREYYEYQTTVVRPDRSVL
jgi:hypothetical protein